MTIANSIDIDTIPELARLAEEVARTRQPRELRRNQETIAILAPVASPSTTRTHAAQRQQRSRAAFFESAGGWRGIVDSERLMSDLESARSSHRPSVEL